MRLQLVRLGTNYQALVFDETKMVPDPQFSRRSEWGGVEDVPPLEPQRAGETAAAFQVRSDAHQAAVAARTAERQAREQEIGREAQRLYETEFRKPVPVVVTDTQL